MKRVTFRVPEEEHIEPKVEALMNEDSANTAPEEQEDNNTHGEQQVFPTEARTREKEKEAEMRKKGIVKNVRKKPQQVEQHFDDCGS